MFNFFTHVANLNSTYRPPMATNPKRKKVSVGETRSEPSLELFELCKIYREVTVPYQRIKDGTFVDFSLVIISLKLTIFPQKRVIVVGAIVEILAHL